MRRAQGRTSPNTKKFETRFILTDLIVGWDHYSTNRRQAILDARLLFDAPPGHPGCRLHPRGSQDLVATLSGWRSHIQQHTHTEIYIKSNEDHTFNYIYQSNITQSL
jgi:hypothetical protein